MSHQESNFLRYSIALFAEFAKHFGLKDNQAYKYLKRFKGLDYLRAYYDVLHTQTFDDAVEALAIVCHKNGGRLVYA